MQEKLDNILDEPLVVINLGLKGFAQSIEQQGAEVAQVDWVPPAGGDQELADLLDRIL
jgi:hypothetical protein